MGYYMLFKDTPGAAPDEPLGIRVRNEDVNALCVFSSGEAAAAARDAAAPDYYLETVTPDDVVSLATIHGVDVVALDAYHAKSAKLIRTVDAAEALAMVEARERQIDEMGEAQYALECVLARLEKEEFLRVYTDLPFRAREHVRLTAADYHAGAVKQWVEEADSGDAERDDMTF